MEGLDYLASMEFWYLDEIGFRGPHSVAELGQPVKSVILDAENRGKVISVEDLSNGAMELIEVIIEQPEPWQSQMTFDIKTHEPFALLTGSSRELQMRIEQERRELLGDSRKIRYHLRKSLGYAVEEKWVSRASTGDVMFHTRNSDFLQVGSANAWIPRRCVVASFAYETSPSSIAPAAVFQTLIEIVSYQAIELGNSEFKIWYDEAGVRISDWTSPRATLEDADFYRVPASIFDMPQKSPLIRNVLILNLIVVLGIVGWWVYRKNRKNT
ncbi:hypothetical protein [Crateriforma conspicua]|uniref:Uncharacterized protein n=1 Tax=Crateriforma conspicua TaxID=2527996 RepID=A0A5C6FMB6_9PLAN|nr:hypothetical protein [Crateriforma conspicua]TWU63177.1 hypothetical protein V7x_49170 [Crateriforma conspicua]